ncbi:hypothetical protein ACIBHX_14590 [Nonomuraea sp. NPDC050536]|uniref:hypothetical protein n=1 Tax=Nonomuraea sp. NPDC050536 TaxID=3364366 RepID=UPI0037C56717
MILGVAYGGPSPVVAAVRAGVLLRTWQGSSGTAGAAFGVPARVWRSARAACVAMDLEQAPRARVAVIRIGGPCPPSLGPPGGSGVATIVRGGHSLTGRQLAPLDTEAVRSFAAGCGLARFAVTAVGSPVTSDHELAAAEVVAAAVPGARITLSYEFSRAGLREREDTAVLNAALGPEAWRLADEIERELPGLPLYFARSAGGLVSAHYFRRYPLVCYRGLSAGAARGDEAQGPMVAAAYGAALAGPAAEVERIVLARGRAELDRALREAREEALTRVVSAGAVPGSAHISSSTVNPLSYLPDGLYRVRVTADGATP